MYAPIRMEIELTMLMQTKFRQEEINISHKAS